MPTEILMSQINGQSDAFRQHVQEHIKKLNEFNKKEGVPRPVTHHLVETAIKVTKHPVEHGKPDEYHADYVIIDDQAKKEEIPEPTFEQKRFWLKNQIVAIENEAKAKILPAMKMRLAALKYTGASSKPAKSRTAEEKEDIKSFELIREAFAKIELQAAQAESDLDDMTEATIDSWQLPTIG